MKRDGQKSSDLSPSVAALVAHERVLPAQPEDVRARILSRAHAATLAGPPSTEPMPVTRAGASQSLAVGTAAVAAAGIAAAIYFFGGSAPSAPVANAPPTLAPSAAAPPEPSSAPAPGPDLARGAPSAQAPPVEKPAPNARPTATSPQESGLEEIQLLSNARKADAQKDYRGVLTVLTEHERNFPAGRLSEEREVLRVKALVGLGRTDQARRAAARFRRQFPKSVLLRKVDEMLASKP